MLTIPWNMLQNSEALANKSFFHSEMFQQAITPTEPLTHVMTSSAKMSVHTFYWVRSKKDQVPHQRRRKILCTMIEMTPEYCRIIHYFHLLWVFCRWICLILCNSKVLEFLHFPSYAEIIRKQVFIENLAYKTGKQCYCHDAEKCEPKYSSRD